MSRRPVLLQCSLAAAIACGSSYHGRGSAKPMYYVPASPSSPPSSLACKLIRSGMAGPAPLPGSAAGVLYSARLEWASEPALHWIIGTQILSACLACLGLV